MRQFTLPLKKNTQRPVVVLNEFYDLEVMLDTGALFPVWVEDEELLKELGGTVVAENVEFVMLYDDECDYVPASDL